MKTSLWHRWCHSLLGVKRATPVSRARPRPQRPGLEVLEDRVTPTLAPQMVLDISVGSSNPSQLAALGSTTYYTADDGVYGVELWKSDGTAAGTTLVKDINPGSPGSNPANLTNVNGTLFFTATYGLWRSDGTPAGTVRVSPLASDSTNFTNVNGTLFFTQYDPTNGRELWKSDGTAAGTTLVKDIAPGTYYGYYGVYPNSSDPRNLTNVNGTLFFTANNGGNGRELWKSDGTEAGTVMVKDINPGGLSSVPESLTAINGTLFFIANDDTHGYELWRSDGTEAGTTVVKDIIPGVFSAPPLHLTNVNGTLFFTANDDVHGYELWRSDGTEAGTTQVKDIAPGGPSSAPRDLTHVNGTLFFAVGVGAATTLWRSDGTEAGTVPVKDVDPNKLTAVGGALFFIASDAGGLELWRSDGTTAGTARVKDIYLGAGSSSPRNLTNVNGTLVFAAYERTAGYELWRSDGTSGGTTLVKDINATVGGNSYPQNLTDVNGTLYFTAQDGGNGREVWRSDGTAAGTTLVKDILPGSAGSGPGNLTNVNGTLFFTTGYASHVWELWKSDGTAAGTVRIKAVTTGSSSSPPNNLTNVNGTLFFTAPDDTHGIELWRSDGTEAGTTLVKDIYPGGSYYYGTFYPNNSNPRELTNVNGTLFFAVEDGTETRLWKSDGTAAGTVALPASRPSNLAAMNGTLFFTAFAPATGYELWKSNGTATTLVKDIVPGSASSYPLDKVAVNGTLYLRAYDATNGYELWKSDGTTAGTVLVKDIWPGSASGDPASLRNVNGTLFFAANTHSNGRELWKSNGTAIRTVLVKDIVPGSAGSDPRNLTAVNGALFFTAIESTGTRLWRSDGTAAGTVVVGNLAASLLTNVNGTLFFSADDKAHGQELWRLVEDASPAPTLVVSGFPATVTAGVAGSFTVRVSNADGSTNTGYRGRVHFTSSDPQAVLPADYTFTADDQGVHTFAATLKTAGSQSLTVGDTVIPGITGTQSGILVTPAAASSFVVTGFPSPATAGVAGIFTVTAWDAYGNRATDYRGTVRFTSSDRQASLPGNYTFTAADAGQHAFGATLRTAGGQVLFATDVANATITGLRYVNVNPAAASRLLLTAPASVTAGARFNLTVTLLDIYGNIATDYRGMVTFRSSDAAAKLPGNYTFKVDDEGVRTFTGLVLKKKGRQTITVAGTLADSLTASVVIDVV